MRRVFIHDTTLRDGEQMPGVVFNQQEKLELAKLSIEFGSDFIDIMPSVSNYEKDIARMLIDLYPKKVSATCMMRKEDIDNAFEIGAEQIVLFTPLSDIHLEHKRKISREDNLRYSIESIDYAKSLGLIIDFAAEDCTRADIDYVKDFLSSISQNIRFFYIADTVGYMTPERSYKLTKNILKIHKKIGVHMHNDMGLATANTLSALMAGATCFSGTFTGIGERSGNAPVEEVCVGLKYLYGLDLSVKNSVLSGLCGLVSKYSGISLQSHKPIIGSNAFCHESGIHADGVIKNPATYEHVNPEFVGSKRTFYFGKHTGRNVLRHFLSDLSSEEIDKILEYIKSVSQSTKYMFSEDDIIHMGRKMKNNSVLEV